MRVKFSLSIEPFSYNNLTYKNKTFKTSEYKDYERRFFTKLAMKEPQEALKKIRENFDTSKHALVMRITFNRPNFFTAKGEISAQSMDLSNLEKIFCDLVCLKKYSVLPIPWGAPNCEIDDKYIISLTSRKRFAPAELIQCSIAIVDKPTKS